MCGTRILLSHFISYFLSMETSLFIAQVLAICYLSVGIGFLISKEYYRKEVTKLLENPGFVLLGGYFAIIIGALILRVQNTWESDWTTLVTIIGWIAIIKGIWLIVFPKSITQFKTLLQAKYHNWVSTAIIVLGLIFAYFGFFV